MGFETHDNHVGNVMLCQLSYTRLIDSTSANNLPNQKSKSEL